MVINVRRDDWPDERSFDAFRQLALEVQKLQDQISFVNKPWTTATVAGSGTPGTYELASSTGQYTKIGRRVWLDLVIVLAGAITGGGTGDLIIQNLPFPINGPAVRGYVSLSGVDWTAGANLTSKFRTSTTIAIEQTLDNAAATTVPVSGVAANDAIFIGISYETNS